VFDQAARYNLKLQVPFLVITNGMDLMAAEITENRIEFLKELPPVNCD
jgi:CTP synthase (UTP-ammonia lyase)